VENEILKVAYAEGCRVALIDAGYDVKTAESLSADLVEKMAPKENQFAPQDSPVDAKKKKK
jgi:hypothetical protein